MTLICERRGPNITEYRIERPGRPPGVAQLATMLALALVLLLVAAGVAPTDGQQPPALARRAAAASLAAVLLALLWSRLTRVYAESVVLLQRLGVQLERRYCLCGGEKGGGGGRPPVRSCESLDLDTDRCRVVNAFVPSLYCCRAHFPPSAASSALAC